MVADLDLHVRPGERVLLAGASGAGKSTILHALVGALGETFPGDLSGDVAAGGTCGLVTQQPGDAIVAGTIGRDAAFGPENLGLSRAEIWRRADAAVRSVALPYGRDHPTDALSGGETQRLALAGALALEPDVLLLDEPTAMLDDASAATVRSAVADVLARTAATLVVVEHRIEPWLELVDRVVVLGAEGVLADTDPTAFVERHRDRLGEAGVWMPGLPAPDPLVPPTELVRPVDPPLALTAERLGVTLTRRSVRGATRSRALDGIDACFEPGAAHVLVGPSGAGKSTLVAALGGLLAPTDGRVGGWPDAPHRLTSLALSRRLGWVPQVAEHAFATSTVAQEVGATAALLERAVDVEAVLDHLGLTALAGRNPYRLSGGEQRRLALAAGLAHRPALALLDEPTVGQDRRTWAAVAGWWRAAADAGATAVASTHDEHLVALADTTLRLERGVRA